MDITPYVETLRGRLVVAAETGGEDARALAEQLTAALDPAVRLALLNALSDAAGEITEELAPGSVDLRLRGGEPTFVVTPPAGEAAEGWSGDIAVASSAPVASTAVPPAPEDAEDGGTARITLRMPEHLKPRIEEAARSENLSVNAWLVRAVSAALDPQDRPSTHRPGPDLGQSFTGWVR